MSPSSPPPDSFPTSTGVYLMKDAKGNILYIGKAKNLRARIRQYYTPGHDDRPMLPFLMAHVAEITTLIVASEKEALLLENNLIKQYQPKYNALLKDDKTYCSLLLNGSHPWPSLRLVRFREPSPSGDLYFGPYAHGSAARDMLTLLRELFPLRQCSDRELEHRTRPCLLYELKRCLAPCVQACTSKAYHAHVDQLIRFLRGEDQTIVNRLKRERDRAIQALEFEKAATIHATLQHIELSLEQQYVEIEDRASCDVLGLYRTQKQVALVRLSFREGKLCASRDYCFAENAQSDADLLTSFILQEYLSQETPPQKIILPIALLDHAILEALLPTKLIKATTTVPLALVQHAYTNAKAVAQHTSGTPSTHTRAGMEARLLELQETLGLTNYPGHIACFDHSHLSGKESVSVMVVFLSGYKNQKSYRTYTTKEAAASDDYGALRECLRRCYRQGDGNEERSLPDLLLIDGGKGHLKVVYDVFAELGISTVDVLAISKEASKHTHGLAAEKLFIRERHEPILLAPHHPLLLFLQKIRDEAHRFAIRLQRKKRAKKSLATTKLPGIGPVKSERLLRHFGSWQRILQATPEAWQQVKGITRRDIKTLQKEALIL